MNIIQPQEWKMRHYGQYYVILRHKTEPIMVKLDLKTHIGRYYTLPTKTKSGKRPRRVGRFIKKETLELPNNY